MFPKAEKRMRSFLSNSGRVLSLRLFKKRRSVRLGVRTPDFHSGNTGSIPVRTTEYIYNATDNQSIMVAFLFLRTPLRTGTVLDPAFTHLNFQLNA